MKQQPAIEVEDVHRVHPLGQHDLHILRGLTFEIGSGEWVALMGPSGSGKSTLLGILAGIDKPTHGRVRLNGTEISSLPEHRLAHFRNQQIGIVFQSFNLISTMTAQENVEIPLYIGPRAKQAAKLAQEVLALVGLEKRLNHLPHQLSGGEQQRVAIARALVTQPRFLLADEPTGNLDSVTSQQILNLFAQLRQQLDLTMVVTTHAPYVATYADRVLTIKDGQFTAVAESQDEPAKEYSYA